MKKYIIVAVAVILVGVTAYAVNVTITIPGSKIGLMRGWASAYIDSNANIQIASNSITTVHGAWCISNLIQDSFRSA